ncbi:winged helix-turn-helix domain-containing protein [Enterobacter kobei]|nr:winged helix-turn-helix domain-containing protein [Enterobacter kobei]
MAYIIEDTVLFDEVKGSLINITTGDEVRLPPTAVCILLILFSSQSSPVERSTFIEQVNARFGFDLSNNTLNQYISLLRKNIKSLGVDDDLIITVPRVGFYISRDLNVIEKSSSPIAPNLSTLSAGRSRENRGVFICIIIILAFIAEMLYLTLPRDLKPQSYLLEKTGKIGMCDLYMPVNLKKVHLKNSESAAVSLAERYLPCIPGSVFIYDINAMEFLNGTGTVYLARCSGESEKNSYAVCAEVKFNG